MVSAIFLIRITMCSYASTMAKSSNQCQVVLCMNKCNPHTTMWGQIEHVLLKNHQYPEILWLCQANNCLYISDNVFRFHARMTSISPDLCWGPSVNCVIRISPRSCQSTAIRSEDEEKFLGNSCVPKYSWFNFAYWLIVYDYSYNKAITIQSKVLYAFL